jgi:hypothetical protein
MQELFEVSSEIGWKRDMEGIDASSTTADFQFLSMKTDVPGIVVILKEILPQLHFPNVALTHGHSDEEA